MTQTFMSLESSSLAPRPQKPDARNSMPHPIEGCPALYFKRGLEIYIVSPRKNRLPKSGATDIFSAQGDNVGFEWKR
jgi:hypothetical protein